MKFTTNLIASTIAIAMISVSSNQVQAVPGQWQPTELTPELSALLMTGLRNIWGYKPGVNTLVCVKNVQAVSQQLASGNNYLYTTSACRVQNYHDVGFCQNKQCIDAPTQIELFSNPATNTLQVFKISLV
jgi:hypothetical protein